MYDEPKNSARAIKAAVPGSPQPGDFISAINPNIPIIIRIDETIQKSKDELELFIQQQGIKRKSLEDEIAFEKQILAKKLAILKQEYGGAPLIQFNQQHFNKTDIDVSPWLVDDVKLIEQAGEIGMFYYGPRFWMLGEVEPLKSLQNENERNEIVEKILTTYPIRELTDKEYFYRVRVNPKISHNFSEYDTAPDEFLGKNRFDDIGFPVLYGSPDLELCLHECRTTVEDNLFVAKLVPTHKLKVLDLSTLLDEENITEFESIDIAIHFLFLAGKHSYNICRQIALKAKEKGFDGIIYPSYFSYIRTGAFPFETIYGISIRRIPQLKDYAQSQSIPNLALFGRPVNEKKVTVDCINKIVINRVGYDITFGPAYHKAYEEESDEQDSK